MCLVLVAHHTSAERPLLVLANRDEFYDRPTAAASRWVECPELIGGRDLVSGGSWFGARGLKWGSVTNVRDGERPSHRNRSRGWLVRDYLLSGVPPQEFLSGLVSQREDYAGFNLLLGDREELWYCSNRGPMAQKLAPGIYGLSNHLLDTPWPKVVHGKRALSALLDNPSLDRDQAFALLADTTRADDEELPVTGIPLDWERALSAAFISINDYGTRCTTLLTRTASGKIHFVERRFSGRPDHWEETEFSWASSGCLLDT